MRLKVMMPISLDVPPELAPFGDEVEYTVYDDVTSCQFRYIPDQPDTPYGDAYGEAHLMVREPVKTAEVPGYAEVSKCIMLSGDAFLMNDQGRTFSTFKRKRSRRAADTSSEIEEPRSFSDTALRDLPYTTAVLIRRAAGRAGIPALLKLLDDFGIAVDA